MKRILIEPFEDGDYFLGILIWIVFLIFIGLISALLIHIVDSAFMPTYKDKGIIENKFYKPAYTYVTYITTGKTTIPQVHYMPESFNITIDVSGLTDNVKTYQVDYEKRFIGEKLDVEYSKGRLFNTIYIHKFN